MERTLVENKYDYLFGLVSDMRAAQKTLEVSPTVDNESAKKYLEECENAVDEFLDDSENFVMNREEYGEKITKVAEWQPADNYGCWQTEDMFCDTYSGYLLFPTYQSDTYFCIKYSC